MSNGPNLATTRGKQAVAKFVDDNADKLSRWIDAIERKHGELAAFQCVERLLEYHIPKLSRQEVTGERDVNITVSWKGDTPVAHPAAIMEKYVTDEGYEGKRYCRCCNGDSVTHEANRTVKLTASKEQPSLFE